MVSDSVGDLGSDRCETSVVAHRAASDASPERLVRPVDAYAGEGSAGDRGDLRSTLMAIFTLTDRGYDVDTDGESFE